MLLINSRHPHYSEHCQDYLKWRLAYEGGRDFINRYLRKLSAREDEADFLLRKDMAYCPAFAATAINEIKNSIYQRITDVQRLGGPESYQRVIKNNEAVDLEGNKIDTLVGSDILREMLVMSKCGVLVDMPDNLGVTLLDKGDKHPYLSIYTVENILSWSYKSTSNEKFLNSILLCEYLDVCDSESGLITSNGKRYRHMKLVEGGVQVTFYDDKNEKQEEKLLRIPRIPFTLFEIPYSLMTTVSDYQIALMNLESSDISFARKANFPIYYEFYDPKSDQPYKKPVGPPTASDGTNSVQNTGKDRETAVGLTKGRKFPLGTSPPGFINPSPLTLEVSMKKGQQLRDDIFRIVNLNVSNLSSSAESKQADKGTLESGLSFIGLMLEKGETDVARHWTNFENSSDKPKIVYPKSYSIESEEVRQKRAEHLSEMANKVVSDTYRRTVSKRIAKITVGCHVTDKELEKIYDEIDKAKTLTCDPDQIIADHEAGFVSDELASEARGYPKGEVEKARKDHIDRLKRIMDSQGGPENASAARGVPDVGGKSSSDEKQGKEKRGTADKVIKE